MASSFEPASAKIASGVGNGGLNRPDDVRVIQALLNRCRVGGPKTKLEVNGNADAPTRAAILAFQVRFFGSSIWSAKWQDGRVDPHGPTMWLLKTVASNTETATASVSIRVPGVFQPITQIGPTCWAAATAILIGWKKQNRSVNVRDEMAALGNEWLGYYDNGNGLPVNKASDLARAAGMSCMPPASYRLSDLLTILRRPSPTYVSFSMNAASGHAVVVVGADGDGTSIGTELIIYDTASQYSPDRIPFVLLSLWMGFTQTLTNGSNPGSMPSSQLLYY
jgi:hypothetical protein